MARFMRDGKFCPEAMEGVDVAKLDHSERAALKQTLDKAASGKAMKLEDVKSVMDARRKCGV